MTFQELRQKLARAAMFSQSEIDQVICHCGIASLGNAIAACEYIGIKLYGTDIDILIAV